VFDGIAREPYTEEDRPNPLNVYGGTKLLGEHFTVNYARRGAAVRVSGIYGRIPCRAKGGNFVTTMVKAAREKPRVRVVTDEVLSPTSTAAIARATAVLVETDLTGTVHMVCEDHCSWYDFARVIFSTLGLKTPLLPARSSEFPSTVRRPAFSALKNARLAGLGIFAMPHWRDALVEFLSNDYGDSPR
jgi:dTDP-4-dehydrorhamnose reductase